MSETQASIPIPFAIGETVWWPGTGYAEKYPECRGTLAIDVILGNGEKHTMGCEACRIGYDPPRGVVKVQCGEHKPTPYVCQRVEIRGNEITYQMDSGSGGYWPTDAKNLFRDAAACAAECDRLNIIKRANDEANHIGAMSRHRKSIAYSAHYWRGRIADMEKDLVRARARLSVCKKPRKETARHAGGDESDDSAGNAAGEPEPAPTPGGAK